MFESTVIGRMDLNDEVIRRIIAYTDPLGASSPRIKVQVKRRQDKTNVDGVRSFLAVLGTHDVGLFISAGGFTSDAEREVRSRENRRITLIDLEKLFEQWSLTTTTSMTPTRVATGWAGEA